MRSLYVHTQLTIIYELYKSLRWNIIKRNASVPMIHYGWKSSTVTRQLCISESVERNSRGSKERNPLRVKVIFVRIILRWKHDVPFCSFHYAFVQNTNVTMMLHRCTHWKYTRGWFCWRGYRSIYLNPSFLFLFSFCTRKRLLKIVVMRSATKRYAWHVYKNG